MSIGESLSDARREAGLTVTQVSQQTRIRESIIRDIEQGDFASSGGDFYARGHIRSIAGVVGTDPAPLISEYDADHGPMGPLRAADVFEPSKPIKIRERRSPSMTMIVVVVLLAIIGFAAYRLVSSHDNKSGPAAGAGVAATTSTQPSVRPTPSASASPTPSVTPSDVVIKVAAVEECWVLLTRTSDGSQIYHGGRPGGQLDDLDREAGGEHPAGQSGRDRPHRGRPAPADQHPPAGDAELQPEGRFQAERPARFLVRRPAGLAGPGPRQAARLTA